MKILLLAALCVLLASCSSSSWVIPDEVHVGFAHNTGGDDIDGSFAGPRSFSYDQDDSQTYGIQFVYKVKPTYMIVLESPTRRAK